MTDEKQAAIKTFGLKMVYNPGIFQRRKLALDGLDLEVPSGAIYGYLGQNGAGKTTTIKVLVGLQYATAGQAWIKGLNIQDPQARFNIGFMPENPYFYEYLTAFETLDFYGQLSGMGSSDRHKRAEELLEIFSLSHARDIRMREFSKGMRQRLGLAQAILHDPSVVILDEPMSGLDPLGRRDIRNVILNLRDRGRTVFFSSHVLGDVAEICDGVCVIHQGRKVADGPIHSLLSSKVVEVKLAASGIPDQHLPETDALAVRTWNDGTLFHVIVDSEQKAEKAKDVLERAGGTIRIIQPQHESLEEYFIRITDSDAAQPTTHQEAPQPKDRQAELESYYLGKKEEAGPAKKSEASASASDSASEPGAENSDEHSPQQNESGSSTKQNSSGEDEA